MASAPQTSLSKTEFIIFFSVDIINSSLHKNVIASDKNAWYKHFKDFFGFFTTHLESKKSRIEFKVWKILGDEIIFSGRLYSYHDIIEYIDNFQRALVTFNKKDSNHTKDSKKIKCKGTIWIANFPVYNMFIHTIPKFPLDYVGPAIDAGFRLSSFSSERKLMISVDAAYTLCTALSAIRSDDERAPKFKICYEGVFELRGVYNNKPYPIFWIDNYPTHIAYEIIKERTECSLQVLVDDCRKYIAHHSSMCIPFFTKDEEKRYKPETYDEHLRLMGELMSEYGDSEEEASKDKKTGSINFIKD